MRLGAVDPGFPAEARALIWEQMKRECEHTQISSIQNGLQNYIYKGMPTSAYGVNRASGSPCSHADFLQRGPTVSSSLAVTGPPISAAGNSCNKLTVGVECSGSFPLSPNLLECPLQRS